MAEDSIVNPILTKDIFEVEEIRNPEMNHIPFGYMDALIDAAERKGLDRKEHSTARQWDALHPESTS